MTEPVPKRLWVRHFHRIPFVFLPRILKGIIPASSLFTAAITSRLKVLHSSLNALVKYVVDFYECLLFRIIKENPIRGSFWIIAIAHKSALGIFEGGRSLNLTADTHEYGACIG